MSARARRAPAATPFALDDTENDDNSDSDTDGSTRDAPSEGSTVRLLTPRARVAQHTHEIEAESRAAAADQRTGAAAMHQFWSGRARGAACCEGAVSRVVLRYALYGIGGVQFAILLAVLLFGGQLLLDAPYMLHAFLSPAYALTLYSAIALQLAGAAILEPAVSRDSAGGRFHTCCARCTRRSCFHVVVTAFHLSIGGTIACTAQAVLAPDGAWRYVLATAAGVCAALTATFGVVFQCYGAPCARHIQLDA